MERRINVEEHFKTRDGIIEIEANREECMALADRMEFDSVNHVTLKGAICKKDDQFVFEGVLSAEVTHSLAGEKETDSFEEDITILCLEAEPEEDPEDDFEIMEDGFIDFGEIAIQYVCMASCAFALGEERLDELMTALEGEEDPENAFKKLEELLQSNTKH